MNIPTDERGPPEENEENYYCRAIQLRRIIQIVDRRSVGTCLSVGRRDLEVNSLVATKCKIVSPGRVLELQYTNLLVF